MVTFPCILQFIFWFIYFVCSSLFLLIPYLYPTPPYSLWICFHFVTHIHLFYFFYRAYT